MNSADNRILLQPDIRCLLQGRCAPNFLKVNISKSRIITFIKYFPYYVYKESDSSLTVPTLFKDLGFNLIGNYILKRMYSFLM